MGQELKLKKILLCDCKAGHDIISPIIGFRCPECGVEKKDWEVVRPDILDTLQHENGKMRDVLKEMIERNNLRNDFDMYLFDLCRWGIGDESEKPSPDDFGI